MSDRFKINPAVLIACPTLERRPISWEFAEYFYAIRQPLGTSISRMRVEGKDVATARNEIAAEALRQNADYVLYVGDDVLVPPDIIERLRAHREAMVTGVYFTKSYPSAPYLWRGLQKGPCVDWKMGEYFPIDWAGCDALLISTEVFRNVPYPWFSLDWKFEEDQPNCPLATEDLYAYTKFRQHGYQLYVDTAVQCDHQDRASLQRFGLTHEMPQYPGAKVRPADGLHVAELGAGHDTPHWNGAAKVVRFDGNPDCHPDVRCDLRKIPWEDASFDLAHARHCLEHMAPFEAPAVLKEWARIVKPGGKLIINVPNLAYAAKEILRADSDPNIDVTWYPHWQVFGRQTGHETDVHRNGFTRHGLRSLFLSCGLSDVVVSVVGDAGENLEAVATIPEREPPLAIGPAWRAIEQAEQTPTNGHAAAIDLDSPAFVAGGDFSERPVVLTKQRKHTKKKPEPAEAVAVPEG